MKWINVNDQLPIGYETILFVDRKSKSCWVGHYDHDNHEWYIELRMNKRSFFFLDEEILLWMYLPRFPHTPKEKYEKRLPLLQKQ